MQAGPETTELEVSPGQQNPDEFAVSTPSAREFLDRTGLVQKLAMLKNLNEQFQTENPQCQEMFPVIESDPELLKRFLKFSNGGWFQSRIKVDSPYMAFTRYGTQGFYKLALAAYLSQGIGELGTRYKIWPHLESVARTGEMVAAQLAPKSTDDIFIAGLLHDAVVPAMEKELTDYLYFLECAMDLDPFVTRLENSAHNFDHAQAAGELAAALGFKQHIVDAVTHHHGTTLMSVGEGRSRATLSLLLITKRVQYLRRSEKRTSFETPTEKKLLEEISLVLAVSSSRIQMTVTDIVDDLRMRDANTI